jgi:hypothetical protein
MFPLGEAFAGARETAGACVLSFDGAPGAESRVTSDVMCFTDSGVRRRTSHSSAIRFHRESAASLPVGVLQHLQSSNLGPPYKMLTSRLFGYSTLTLASGLGSAGANWGPNLLYQIGGSRSIQLALNYSSES